jgi:Lrp/AsnC family leucine-responsive transcriptional regulator
MMPIKKNEVKVLRALCRDARRTLEDIGNETGLTGPGVGKIIDRLEDSGVITSYIALPALEKIGFNVVSILLFRWDHSKGKIEDLNQYMRETKGVILATPVQGSDYSHMIMSAHPDFAEVETFVRAFRARWDGLIRGDTLLLMSPDGATKKLNFEVF